MSKKLVVLWLVSRNSFGREFHTPQRTPEAAKATWIHSTRRYCVDIDRSWKGWLHVQFPVGAFLLRNNLDPVVQHFLLLLRSSITRQTGVNTLYITTDCFLRLDVCWQRSQLGWETWGPVSLALALTLSPLTFDGDLGTRPCKMNAIQNGPVNHRAVIVRRQRQLGVVNHKQVVDNVCLSVCL